MKSFVRTLCILTAVELMLAVVSVPAVATVRPVVSGLSTHSGVYWGASRVTVHGLNFTHVKKVLFGAETAYALDVRSSTTLTVSDPEHNYGTVHVRVVTSAGTSSIVSAGLFTYTHPSMDSPIMSGMSARQEQRKSAQLRAAHRGVHTAPRSTTWTAAMGVTAVSRARSWLGLPYSWAGGNGSGPTQGVCAHNGGDMDCHVVGFDCSGLALYAWSPYESLVHYASTQHSQAGRFHPAIGQLMPGDLVFFSGYISNGIGHVAVYEGGGMVIQAAQSGTQVMRSRLVDVIAESGRYRGATRPMSSGQQGPGPSFSSITAQVSARGGNVTITGSRLSAAISVSVGGKVLYSFAKRTATRLVVKVPAHQAGRVTVVVSNAWGSAQRTLTYVAPPQQSSLTPSSGPISGGNAVTVTGRDLTTVSKVTVGSTSVKFTIASSRQLTLLRMPAHAAGSVTVTLYSRFGTSNQMRYSYVVPPPKPTPTPTPTPTVTPTSTSTSTSSPTVKPTASPTVSGSATLSPVTPPTNTSSTSTPSTTSSSTG